MAEDRDGYQQALKECETLALPVDAEVVGVRIRALAEAVASKERAIFVNGA